jgi:hypothetical protein
LSNAAVKRLILNGKGALPPFSNVEGPFWTEFYELLQKCWKFESEQRISLTEIIVELKRLKTKFNLLNPIDKIQLNKSASQTLREVSVGTEDESITSDASSATIQNGMPKTIYKFD